MKLILKHKFTVFVIIVFCVLVVFAFFIDKMFFSNNGIPIYGNRLDGIEEVAIGSDQYTKLKTEISANKNVTEITYNLRGRTINVIITVTDKLSKADAKKIGANVLTYFDAKQLAYYDFQVFMKKVDVAQNDFPIIGYKHNNTKNLVWTRDRKVSK